MKQMTDLSRFHIAQRSDYQTALAEIRRGRKESHWIWYIFPQLRGLGESFMSYRYGIQGIEEARAYLMDPVLGPRLTEISEALLGLPGSDIRAVMDPPDDRKLRSSMTLFSLAAEPAGPEKEIFDAVLNKYFGGKMDEHTVRLIRDAASIP